MAVTSNYCAHDHRTVAEWWACPDAAENRNLARFEARRRESDLSPIFTVRMSPRGGAEQVGGRSLLLSVTVDVLVLAWLVTDELVFAHPSTVTTEEGKCLS